MKRLLATVLVFGLTWAWVSAQDVKLNPDQPGTYVVVEGDTLWDIAGKFLAEPWQWPEIWEGNPQVENPHLIYPGDVLTLSYRDGRPVLSGSRTVRLSPSVRSYERDRAIPPIPLDAIQQFLSRPLVVTAAEIDASPYVVGNQDGHLISGSGNRIYVRGVAESATTSYSLYRKGEPYLDPDRDGALLGFEALHVGDVQFERWGDPATAHIVRSSREVLVGDRLMPQLQDEYLEFVPRAPDSEINGAIISVIDGVSQIGQYQIVVLNVGTAQGIGPGHVLAIFQAGELVQDRVLAQSASGFDGVTRGDLVQLPEERAGELMVFRSFEQVSYGLVMRTQRPVHLLDRVKNP
jgi:hypothetical protein